MDITSLQSNIFISKKVSVVSIYNLFLFVIPQIITRYQLFSWCLSYSSIAGIRHHDQSNLWKTEPAWALAVQISRAMTVIAGHLTAGRPGAGAGAKSLHLNPPRQRELIRDITGF